MNKNVEQSTIWNRVYSNFKGDRRSLWNKDPTPWITQKIPYLKLRSAEYILDAGCGDGRNLLPFCKNGFTVTGIDCSNIAIERAKGLQKHFTNLSLSTGNLEDLDFKEDFDVLVSDYVLVHVKNIERGPQSSFGPKCKM